MLPPGKLESRDAVPRVAKLQRSRPRRGAHVELSAEGPEHSAVKGPMPSPAGARDHTGAAGTMLG
eukprot:14305717-Alexandrium_andersonii.AAC.1